MSFGTLLGRSSVGRCIALGAALAAGPAAPAVAHHSMARFDAERVVSIDGVVTRYEWANPHVYIYLETTTATGEKVEWEIEGSPPAILRRQGWSKDTLAVGDVLSVSGNPYRDESRKGVFLVSMKRGDASLYARAEQMRTLMSRGDAPAAQADGLEGTWVTVLNLDLIVATIEPAENMSLTEAGAAAEAAFDEETMSPGADCIASPAPHAMIMPDIKSIDVEEDAVVIRGEFDGGERVVRLDLTSHDGATPSVQGHAIGRWEGETLVVDTALFAPHAQGLADSLPSTAEKHLVERFSLDPDRTSLTYAFELTDPPHLAAPFAGTVTWAYRPDLELAVEPCDIENARRFIGE